MRRYGKRNKLKRCKGCSHWVKVVRIYLETCEVEVSAEHCDSEETMSAGCVSHYLEIKREEERKIRLEQEIKFIDLGLKDIFKK